MTATKPARRTAGTEVSTRDQVIEKFVNLVNLVPDAPAGDITDLLGPILAAATWEDLQNTEGIPSSKSLAKAGHKIRVDDIAKKVSDKTSLTGYYLLCNGVDIDSGEVVRFTAGGAQAVAVLSQLHVLRALPAFVQFIAVGLLDGNEAINAVVLGSNPGRTIDA